MMQELSARREIVQLLDSEPLLDYLHQNGVISKDDVDALRMETDTSKQNLMLLKCIEMRPTSRQLFTNVLRQTGQHYLANLIDDSTRIKVYSGSGYLSTSRHKGEVSLVISVDSLKLADESFQMVAALLHKDWISLEDIQMKISSLKRLQSAQRSSMIDAQHETNSFKAVDQELNDNRICCYCCCCAPKHRSKSDKYKLDTLSELLPAGNDVNNGHRAGDSIQVVVTCQPRSSLSGSLEFAPSSQASTLQRPSDARVSQLRTSELKTGSIESLRSLAHSIQSRSQELYNMLADANAPIHNQLLRYFEQDCGVLVLGTTAGNDGLRVLCICTKLEHATHLNDDYQSSKLAADLQRIISTDSILSSLGVIGLKVAVNVNTDDLNAVKQELQ